MSARAEHYASEVRTLWAEEPETREHIEWVTGQSTPETIYAWALGEYFGATNNEEEPREDWLTWGIFVEEYDRSFAA